VSLVVGLLFGEVMPALPLYVPEALCVEIAALVFARRTALFTGAASGALLGTLGFAGEWGWTHLVYRLPWHVDLLPEGLILAVVGGVAGGIAGSLLAGGLRGELPAPRVARIAALGATLALAAGLVVGLHTSDPNARATLALRTAHGTTSGTVTITPPSLAHDAEWVNLTAWQGNDKLRVAALEEIRPGVFRLPAGIPAHGGWKSLVRVHKGAAVVAAPCSCRATARSECPRSRRGRARAGSSAIRSFFSASAGGMSRAGSGARPARSCSRSSWCSSPS